MVALWLGICRSPRLIPKLPKSNEFKRELRNKLLKDWPFAKHYVDSALKTADSILESWRQNYLKGRRRRKKPVVKRKFVRVKTTLMKVEGSKVRVTVKPREEYLELDFSGEWFYERIKDWKVGELVIRENDVLLTFSKEVKFNGKIKIGVDSNLMSLDIFHPKKGWIKVDLSELHRITETYDRIIDRLKSIQRKAPKRIGRLLKKYYARRRNRVEDFLNKLVVQLSREFPDAVFVFEDLNKFKMFNGSKRFNRKLSRTTWGKIVQKLSYRAPVELVNPAYTSSICPKCGSKLESRNGLVECHKCGFKSDRQFLGAFNVFVRGLGVALSGGKADDLLSNELRGELRLMSPKSVVGVDLNGRTFTHFPSQTSRRTDPVSAGFSEVCAPSRVKEIIFKARPKKSPEEIMFLATYLPAIAVKSVFKPDRPYKLEENYSRALKIHIVLVLLPLLTLLAGVSPPTLALATILSLILHKLDFNYHKWKLEYEWFRS